MVNGKHVTVHSLFKSNPGSTNQCCRFGQEIFLLTLNWDVTVNKRNEIAVTDSKNNLVQIFSTDGGRVQLP